MNAISAPRPSWALLAEVHLRSEIARSEGQRTGAETRVSGQGRQARGGTAVGQTLQQLVFIFQQRLALLPWRALVALAQAGTVMAWDPDNRTLIAANIVGQMPWTARGGSSP